VPLSRRARDSQHLGGFFNRAAREKLQLDDLGVLWMLDFELTQCRIQA
jgi:hypothetical protein